MGELQQNCESRRVNCFRFGPELVRQALGPVVLIMPEQNHKVLFLYNGAPSPAMLDMIAFASKSGLNPILVLLDRGETLMLMDKSLIGYQVIRLKVTYKAVELNRILSMPSLFVKVRRIVAEHLVSDGIIVTASLDMLILARLAAAFRNYELRHQVRDLHPLQLNTGLIPFHVRRLERWMLRRVKKLVVSSPKFASEYYEDMFNGEIVLLENVPRRSVWSGFERNAVPKDALVIGYIGVLRYKESLFALIDTVQRLANDGYDTRVFFAGGGLESDIAEIKDRISMPHLFEFSGPYEYARDIKRLYQNIDLIYAVYDENNRNCQLAMPNKFYESIITKIPILVAANTFLGEQVREWGIGELVKLNEPDSLYALLRDARKPDSWYAQAMDRLNRSSPARLFEQYDGALAKAVL